MSNKRKKLIFFTNSDPALMPQNIEQAYHFANVATRAGLEAEVRLAGDAVKVAVAGAIADSPSGLVLQEKVKEGPTKPFDISF